MTDGVQDGARGWVRFIGRGLSSPSRIAALGVLAAGGVVLFRTWSAADTAMGDVALIEIETRRVFSSDPPLLGAYSRYGWRHAGPALFYLLAAPYRLFGQGARALSSAALLLNMSVMLAAVLLARRRGPAAGAVIGASLVLLAGGMGVDGIASSWNVSMTLMPLALVVVGCWCALCGDTWAFPIASVTYVFALVTHIGTGILATPLVLVTTIWLVIARRHRTRHDARRRLTWGALGVGMLLVPVVVDTVTRPPGNLYRIVAWSSGHDEPIVGWLAAMRLLGRSSSVTFLTDPRPGQFWMTADTSELGLLPGWSVLLLAAALVVAVRSRWRSEAFLCAAVATLWVSGLLAARSIVAPPAWWLVDWLQPLGWLTIAAVALVLCRTVATATRGIRWPRRCGTALLVAALLVGALGAGRAIDSGRRDIEAVLPIAVLADATQSSLRSPRERIEIAAADFLAESLLAGLVNELDSRAVDVCVDVELAYKFPSMVCDGQPRVRLLVRSEATETAAPEASTLVAVSDPLSSAVRRRTDEIHGRLSAVLQRSGRSDLVPILETPLVADVLLGPDVGAEISGFAADIEWLDSVRSAPGTRYGLYALSALDAPSRRP